MSLPALLKISFNTASTAIPYIFPDIHLIQHWHTTMNSNHSFKIGICWHADPNNDANRPPCARRSIAPETFASLSPLTACKIYNLQYGHTAPSFMHDFGTHLDTDNGRFMDTAAIICNLSLVITVDTAIAHLAGALGVPTWLLLPVKADWRWMHSIDYNPFYPGMRIFRQQRFESWQSVLETVKRELICTFSLS